MNSLFARNQPRWGYNFIINFYTFQKTLLLLLSEFPRMLLSESLRVITRNKIISRAIMRYYTKSELSRAITHNAYELY